MEGPIYENVLRVSVGGFILCKIYLQLSMHNQSHYDLVINSEPKLGGLWPPGRPPPHSIPISCIIRDTGDPAHAIIILTVGRTARDLGLSQAMLSPGRFQSSISVLHIFAGERLQAFSDAVFAIIATLMVTIGQRTRVAWAKNQSSLIGNEPE